MHFCFVCRSYGDCVDTAITSPSRPNNPSLCPVFVQTATARKSGQLSPLGIAQGHCQCKFNNRNLPVRVFEFDNANHWKLKKRMNEY